MKHLVGKNKKWQLILSVVFLLLFLTHKFSSSSIKQVDLGGDFYLIITSPTIHLVSQENGPVAGHSVQGKHSLVRGKVEFLFSGDFVISGYLSTRFFKEDGLIGFERKNDKEGFFIIDKTTSHVDSGLTGEEYFSKMEKDYGLKKFELLRIDEY